MTVLFRRVRIFDGERVVPYDSLLVRDGVITELGHDLPAPPDAEVHDGHGTRTLMPGLIDAHTHLMGDEPLRQALTFGVTTELSMGDDPGLVAAARADQDAPRGAAIADLRSAGVSAKAPGGHAAMGARGAGPTIAVPQQAPDFVAARLEEGSDYIKIRYDDGGLLGRMAGRELPFVDRGTLAAVTEEARAAGKEAVVHVGTRAAARAALEVGASGLAHVYVDTPADDVREIAALADDAAARGAFVVPTLTIFTLLGGGERPRTGLRDPRFAPYLAPADRALVDQDATPLPMRLDGAAAAVRRFHASGVPLLCGTDANAFLHGVGMHLELELLVAAGLPATAALAAATSAPARIFGLADRGRLEAGRRADLLLVDGDPTADVTATRAIAAIWKAGRQVSRVPVSEREAKDPPARPAAAQAARHDTGAGPTGDPPSGPRNGGCLAQTADGRTGDFALVVAHAGVLRHFRRDNDTWGFPWRAVAELPGDALERPALAVADDGTLEVVSRNGDGRLVAHVRADEAWRGPLPLHDVGEASADPVLLIGPDGVDLVVPGPDGVTHYRRTGPAAEAPWRVAATLPGLAGGVALAGSAAGGRELAAYRATDGRPVTYALPPGSDIWQVPEPVPYEPCGEPGTGTLALVVHGGGADLVLAGGGVLAHLRRTGHGVGASWERRPDLPAPGIAEPWAPSMMRGVFGNLELVVAGPEGQVVPYYLDAGRDTWSVLPAVADGQKVFGDLSIFAAAMKQG